MKQERLMRPSLSSGKVQPAGDADNWRFRRLFVRNGQIMTFLFTHNIHDLALRKKLVEFDMNLVIPLTILLKDNTDYGPVHCHAVCFTHRDHRTDFSPQKKAGITLVSNPHQIRTAALG